MRNMKAWVIGGLAVLVGVALWQPPVAFGGGSPGGALLVPGGKKVDSDCYMELQVFGFASGDVETSKKGSVATCTAGSACDQGPPDDDTCDIAVKVCINQTDPNVACTPPAELDEIKLTGKGKNKGLIDIQLPSALDGPKCFGVGGSSSSAAGAFGLPAGSAAGAFIIELPAGTVKDNGKLKGGTVVIAGKAKAPKGTNPRTDPDKFTFECLPRPASPSGAFLE
jgi:hypothetical protein